MAKFFYIARDKTGKKIIGSEEAPDPEEVVGRLQSRGLVIVDITSESKDDRFRDGAIAKSRVRSRHYGIRSDDLVLFCRQLATLLGAGVTILKSLGIISQQVSSHNLRKVIKNLQKDMEAGLAFHEAIAKHPKAFSDLWVNLVESGEASGNLAIVLSRLASYLERNAVFKRKVISALIYPAVLMFASIFALLFLSIKIIPTFVDLFKGFNITLPLLTRMLVGMSAFIRNYILIIFVIFLFIIFMIRKYIRTREGRRIYEKFLFALPVFGEFFRALVIERFTSEMATLVESGVPILYSLEIVEHSVGNLTLGDIIRKVKDSVRDGKTLSQPLETSGFFDPIAVQMVAIGEEIGELSNMFKRLNAFYEECVDTFLTRFTAMFEPIMLIFMGIIVGLMVVGMFLPIFQISQIR